MDSIKAAMFLFTHLAEGASNKDTGVYLLQCNSKVDFATEDNIRQIVAQLPYAPG